MLAKRLVFFTLLSPLSTTNVGGAANTSLKAKLTVVGVLKAVEG